jgi:hypothetical protein
LIAVIGGKSEQAGSKEALPPVSLSCLRGS